MAEYTEIREIVAPDSAAQGERVDVTVKVKNIDTYWDHVVACVAIVDGLRFIDEAVIIRSGETYSYSGAFLMAGGDVTIYAYTYYPRDTEWILDDQAQKDVALVEVFKGTISRKELEYDEARANIPAFNIPQGQRGLVHIWGRNDMSSNEKMGIWWQVKDPDGVVVEEHAEWEAFWTGPGEAQEFMGGRFDLNKVGTYTIAIQLFMDLEAEAVVDDYYGNLCTVEAAVPEPSFRGFGVAEYVTV
ncbi:hypothetical protein ES703_76200 [subsurface metagenome]